MDFWLKRPDQRSILGVLLIGIGILLIPTPLLPTIWASTVNWCHELKPYNIWVESGQFLGIEAPFVWVGYTEGCNAGMTYLPVVIIGGLSIIGGLGMVYKRLAK